MMVGAAFGMADDDGRGTGIGQHFGRNVAGVGAGRLGVAILAADGNRRAARSLGEASDQGGRRTDHEVGLAREGRCPCDNSAEFGDRGRQAVHLPVARDQRAQSVHRHSMVSF